jgi:hypothetical protein
MTAALLRRTVLGRALAGLFLVLAGTSVAGCGSPAGEPSTPETSQAPEGPPFAVKLDGPDTAGVGDEVTLTLTNVGRLPDAYQLIAEPQGAAHVDQPNLHASPDESVDVKVMIRHTPATIVVKSVGGGAGAPIGQLTIS